MVKWQIQRKLSNKNSTDRPAEIINDLLKNRGILDKADKETFFNPKNPFKISLSEVGFNKEELKKAVERINKAIKNQESIVVYGDYDADGITATAILWETLYSFSKKVMPYIPHRVDEGYGLSKKGIDAVIKEYNPKLIITVDHGVTAIEALEYAKEKLIDVIVSDHHVLPEKKPKPFALIHSTKIGGAGVSWFLAREILSVPTFRTSNGSRDPDRIVGEKLGLSAIGTISDILPLVGINRSLVSEGLKELKKTDRYGFKALLKDALIEQDKLDAFHIAYMIGPRINSSGRITHALDSLRLLCTKSPVKAALFAHSLGLTNKERQKITEETYLHAKTTAFKYFTKNKTKLLFIHDKTYNPGIIGLVAGKLVEEFYRPTIVISQGEIISKASARSVSGFNIISAIRESAELLIDCGGHPMAAGFTVETAKLEILKKRLGKIVDENLKEELLTKSIKIDCEIDFADIKNNLYEKIIQFKPFGFGNPEPLFATKNLKVVEARLVGREGKHLKLRLADEHNIQFNAIAFGKGDIFQKLKKEAKVDLAYTITENDWNGKRLELKVRDIKY